MLEGKIARFVEMNRISKKGEVVFFGSSYLADMNVAELAENNNMDVMIYNRSFQKLTLDDTDAVLTPCVYPLQPSKLFVNIGEEDLSTFAHDKEAFVSKYEWMLLNIHRNCKNCSIYIVSINSQKNNVKEMNETLESISDETGCSFIEINTGLNHKTEISVFNKLKPYIRNFPISFTDAMNCQVG